MKSISHSEIWCTQYYPWTAQTMSDSVIVATRCPVCWLTQVINELLNEYIYNKIYGFVCTEY